MTVSPDAREVRRLLSRLCSELGFCLPAGDQTRLEETPPGTVEAFASAVVMAEGLDPLTMDSAVYGQVKDMVAEEFRRAERESRTPPRA
jgi:hypothetical protein